MRVAIAGAGDLAKYLVEELLALSHEVVVLSRSRKPWFDRNDISFRVTDYSVPSLVEGLRDCEAVISVILDYSMASATAHLALLEACTQTPKCKRYLPSEYGGNIDDYPSNPTFYYANHQPVRDALKAQQDVMWTLFNIGWLSDYLVPSTSRYIKDLGDYHPVNLEANTITIPGTGDEPIAFTAARDTAKAIAHLIDQNDWEHTTYICGETTTWNKINTLLAKYGKNLEVRHRSREDLERAIKRGEPEDEVLAAQYMEYSISGGAVLPPQKLERHKEKYFKDLHFRTVDEFVRQAQQDPKAIV